jgi:O-antigen ligase
MYGWALADFHNSYIGIIVDTGVVGGLLVLAFLVSSAANWYRHALTLIGSGMVTVLVMIIVILVDSTFENHLLRSTDFFLFLFLVLSIRLQLVLRAYRSGRSRVAPAPLVRLPTHASRP